MRPAGVSTARNPDASPKPCTMRSGLVGISLRCRFSTLPSLPMTTTLL